jgi:two-component system, NtrC family, response regulator AtoC
LAGYALTARTDEPIMASRSNREDPTTRKTEPLPTHVVDVIRRGLEQRSRISLILYHADGTETVGLLPELPVVVGRDAPSDVHIPDLTLSREHARFKLAGGKITVEDLGSTNGTWIAGERVAVAELKLGDEVVLGGVLACVHVPGPEGNLGLESEERFRVRLDEEIVRARHFRARFAVVMVRAALSAVSGPGATGELTVAQEGGRAFPSSSLAARARGAPRGRAEAGLPVHVGRWSPAVRALLRPVDRMALYSRDTVHILMPDAGLETAEELAHAITSRRREEDPPLLAGIAVYPDAATEAEALIELSRGATAVATLESPVQSAPMATWVTGDAPEREASIIAGPVMREIIETIERVAQSKIPVILQGETGAGKEVIARLIHDRGPRSGAPMVCVNCGAIAPQLVESMLFGHERGAFTGADRQQKGVFEEASGGTVFLDEIGELPLAAQAALLRVLESKRLTRVGASREIAIDVRIIAATHRDLERMCEEGSFRADLYYRLNTLTLTVPPLRDRVDEIEPLARSFLRKANESNRGQVRAIEPKALELLKAYRWPGNVRELRNAIERAVVVARSEMIREQDLPARVRASASAARPAAPSDPFCDQEPENTGSIDEGKARPAAASTGARPTLVPPSTDDLKAKLQRYEVKLIVDALRAARWNQTEASRALGMPLRTLVHKIKAFGIKRDER